MSSVMSSTYKAAQTRDAKAILWDAERLARFANIDDRQAVEDFRSNNADFLSPAFWDKTDMSSSVFRIPGNLLLGDDVSKLSPATELKPGSSERAVTLSAWWIMREGLRQTWNEHFPLDRCMALIAFYLYEEPRPSLSQVWPPPFQVWPFQRAVMFLGMEPWRARFCTLCGKRFVAAKPAQRFCSTDCSKAARKSSKRTWWADNGPQWREQRSKKHKKSSKRTPRQ